MVRNNNERLRDGEVLEVKLSGVESIPIARDLEEMIRQMALSVYQLNLRISN